MLSKVGGVPRKNRKLLWSALALVVICSAVLASILVSSRTNKVIFQIDTKEYKQKEVDSYVKYPVANGVSRDDASLTLYQAQRNIKIAESLDALPSRAQTNVELAVLTKGLNSKEKAQGSAWFEVLAQDASIKKSIGNVYPNGYKGYVYVFDFAKHLRRSYDASSSSIDLRLAELDKNKAKQRADYYYATLKDKKATPAQILEDVLSDPTVVPENDVVYKQSTAFGYTKNDWQDDVYYQSIRDSISKLSTTGTHAPKIGFAATDPRDKRQVEAYYYILYLESVGKPALLSQTEYTKTSEKIDAKYFGYKER